MPAKKYSQGSKFSGSIHNCNCCHSAHNPLGPYPQLKTSDSITNRNLTVVRDKNHTGHKRDFHILQTANGIKTTNVC